MKWIKLKKSIYPNFIQFVIQHEWKSVNLTSSLINSYGNIKSINELEAEILCRVDSSEKNITGVLFIDKWQFLLPVFSKIVKTLPEKEKTEVLSYLKSKKKLFSVMGVKHDVNMISALIAPLVKTQVEYYLMTTKGQSSPITYNDINVKKANAGDAEKLYPLEKNYIMDEVLVNSQTVNRKWVLKNLRNTCTAKILFFAEIDGVPIAKVNTNAMGINYAQIGGVFTDYKYRRNGYSTILMNKLCNEVSSMNKKCILFVKKSNIPAFSLYKKLGFNSIGEYKINYLNH